MCLAVPGQIVSLTEAPSLERAGRVSFGGVVKEISLAFTPEAQVGDYVIVHAGFAISLLDQAEALAVLEEFANLAALEP
jgi:hydrogenase expression/formation protein HypC